jgi:hypothetical protein
MRLALLAVAALISRVEDASACICCDSKYRRVPIGWSEAGGAVLIQAYDSAECEHKYRLEIWPVGAKEPSGCFDLLGDPEKKIPCANVTKGLPRDRPKPSTQTKTFPKPPAQLDASKVRMSIKRVDPDSSYEQRVTVEVDLGKGWTRVWNAVIQPADPPRASVTVWPNARKDRAVMLLKYVAPGLGNETVDVHWVELK